MIDFRELDTHTFYHITDSDNINSIVSKGLRPRFGNQLYPDGKDTLIQAVYLFHPNNLDVIGNFLEKYDQDELTVLSVNLFKLNPQKFFADEDYFFHHASKEVEENAFYWSEKFGRKVPCKSLFYEHVHASIGKHGTVAYKGVIPPEAIGILDVDEYFKKKLSDKQVNEIKRGF